MPNSNGKHVCMLAQVPKNTTVPPTKTTCFMFQFRELILPCEWYHGTTQIIRSEKRLRDERERVVGPICHPYSALTFCWGCLHMTLTFALFLYIPFQVFMYCPNRFDPFILFGDCMSLINILASFLTGYVDEDSKMIVLEPRRIALHYLRTTFLPDFIGMLPLQIIYFYDNCQYPSSTIMLILKIFRVFTFMKEWRTFLDQLQVTYIKMQGTTVILKIILFFHWMTYIHYQVPCFTIHYLSEDDHYKVWIKRFSAVQHNEDSSLYQKYTANLFMVCGLCIGAGYYTPVQDHIISELLLTSFMGLLGLAFLTYAIATLIQLAIFRQYEVNLYNGRFMELNRYMVFKRLPQYLQRKVKLFINYKYNGHFFDEEVIMNTINEQIKQDINMYGCKRMVMSVPLFQDMPIALINSIIFSLTQVLYMPGQLVVKCGQPGNSLYIISTGTVAVVSSTGREIAHLRDGSFFGETALLRPGTERTATIIALEITEIYKLDNREFLACLQPYPYLKRRLENSFIKQRVTAQR